VVTNPPYELAQQFIEHALRITEPHRGLVAMLLRCDFDSARTRQHLFAQCPAFAKKLVLTKRIVWFAPAKASPSFNHAWYLGITGIEAEQPCWPMGRGMESRHDQVQAAIRFTPDRGAGAGSRGWLAALSARP
jgi:hypothetical protein